MKNRLVLVVNRRSSGYALVEKKIVRYIDELNLSAGERQTYEIEPTDPLDNAQKMAKILQNNDIVLVAGGDGTAHIATNAIILSGKTGIKIKYTGFGNFNDYAHSFSRNHYKACIRALDEQQAKYAVKPLEMHVNGQFYRYIPLYATIGLTAEMAEIFEHPKVRGALKKSPGRNTRLLLSLAAATRFYFSHRKDDLIETSKIKMNETELELNTKTTDLVFMNGPRMARIMRSRTNKKTLDNFGFTALDSSKIIKNLPFLIKGLFGFIPLKTAKKVEIFLKTPQDLQIQIEGESVKLEGVENISIQQIEQTIDIL